MMKAKSPLKKIEQTIAKTTCPNFGQLIADADPKTPKAPPARQKTSVAVVLTGMPKSEYTYNSIVPTR